MVVSYAIIGREHRDAFLLAVGETEAKKDKGNCLHTPRGSKAELRIPFL